MKALGLRPRAFICFSVFGTRDKALALVFDILLEVGHCDWQNVRMSKIWNRIRSESQKVDQANGSLLEYKNFF